MRRAAFSSSAASGSPVGMYSMSPSSLTWMRKKLVVGNQVVDVQDAVEVVRLVLNGLGQHAVGLEAQLLAGQVLVAHADSHRAVDHAPVAGQAEAAFFNLAFAFPADDFGVDQNQRLLPVLGLDYAEALQHADLVGGQPDAVLGRHGLHHVGGQLR